MSGERPTQECDANRKTIMPAKYRFENGKLFVLLENGYVFCFFSIYATTKSRAIKEYELTRNENK